LVLVRLFCEAGWDAMGNVGNKSFFGFSTTFKKFFYQKKQKPSALLLDQDIII